MSSLALTTMSGHGIAQTPLLVSGCDVDRPKLETFLERELAAAATVDSVAVVCSREELVVRVDRLESSLSRRVPMPTESFEQVVAFLAGALATRLGDRLEPSSPAGPEPSPPEPTDPPAAADAQVAVARPGTTRGWRIRVAALFHRRAASRRGLFVGGLRAVATARVHARLELGGEAEGLAGRRDHPLGRIRGRSLAARALISPALLASPRGELRAVVAAGVAHDGFDAGGPRGRRIGAFVFDARIALVGELTTRFGAVFVGGELRFASPWLIGHSDEGQVRFGPLSVGLSAGVRFGGRGGE